MRSKVKPELKSRNYAGAALTPEYRFKLDEILKKTSENPTEFIKRMIENQYEDVVEGRGVIKSLEDRISSFEKVLVEKTNEISSLANKQIESTNSASLTIREALVSNYENLKENNKLLERILNVCVYSSFRIFRAIGLLCNLKIKPIEKGSDEKLKKILNQSVDLSKKESNSFLLKAVHFMDKDIDALVKELTI